MAVGLDVATGMLAGSAGLQGALCVGLVSVVPGDNARGRVFSPSVCSPSSPRSASA